MLDRLPPAWRIESGSLLWQVMRIVGNQLDAFDEDLDRVQRSHWIATAFDRVDLEKLGALFEIPALAWEPDELYRQRLLATIAARLEGAVSGESLMKVVARLQGAADEALALAPVLERGAKRRVLNEFPAQRMHSRSLRERKGMVQPLETIELVNEGLLPTRLGGALFGVRGGKTCVPTLINLTTGDALSYLGRVPCGSMLKLGFTGEDPIWRATAELDGVDVSDRLVGGSGWLPGQVVPLEQPAKPITLARGSNRIWFVPMGLFGRPGFDASVFSNPDPELLQARWGQTEPAVVFDRALFFQEPVAALDLWWDERRPARFDIEIAAMGERREAGLRPQPELDRERLLAILRQTIGLLRAAAVDGRVRPRAIAEQGRSRDRLTLLRPDGGLETNPQDIELAALGALFDFTAKDGARFE
ncbi:hypothetical protein ACNOYE_28295 [Nannocystaceae bacterium ST9]